MDEATEDEMDAALWREAMGRQIDTLVRRQDTFDERLAENTKETKAIKADTAQIVDAFNGAKAAFEFAEKLGKVLGPLLKFAGFLMAAGASIFAAWHGAGRPGADK